MWDLPKGIIQQLTCSSCKRYLSVAPIKVYPNRQVKCGRCCTEDDGGTISILYETVLKAVRFPCIRHIEGCTKIFLISEMENHEEICCGRKYHCFACDGYKDYSYKLLLHIETKHKDMILKDNFFILSIAQSDTFELNKEKKFFYYDEQVLAFVQAYFKANTFTFQMYIVGDEKNKHANVKYSLVSMENQVLFESKDVKCHSWDCFDQPDICTVTFEALNTPKDILLCKFQVVRQVEVKKPMTQPLPMFDPLVDKAIFRFRFDDVLKIKLDERLFSKHKYYIKDRAVSCFIKRSVLERVEYLGCYLNLDIDDNSSSVMVFFQPSLICMGSRSDHTLSTTHTFEESGNWGWPSFLEWQEAVDHEYGYIANNSLTFEIKVHVVDEPIPKCTCPCCKKKEQSNDK